MRNCLLTGGTGIVGSHIIFEWLHNAIVKKTVDHLFLIIRDNEKTAEERLLSILKDESRPEFLNNFSLASCLEKITVISHDLSTITKEVLNKYNFDTVIHCAGSTNLLNTNESKEQVHTQNFLVTEQLLEQLPSKVTRFLYISTAYSFGIQNTKVNDAIENYNVTEFRNPYEESKYKSERFVI
jgi:nucleoside-diphosphate-sugar epimerase